MADSYADRHQAPLHELEALLNTIGAKLQTDVTAYLIGGCAMSMRGLKDATKDADIIVRTAGDRAAIRTVMEILGFELLQGGPFQRTLPKEYEGFHGDLWRLPGQVGLDVFERTIMEDRFVLTDSMAERATEVRKHGRLTVRLCSNEDIFLFKSLTSRPGDIPDIMRLVQTGLDIPVMAQELRSQPVRKGKAWPDHVVEQLEKLEVRSRGLIPWKYELLGD
ncbi:MAG: DUF6036 family nucleotidyltransferase [Ilumatobacteraceae bacterium]